MDGFKEIPDYENKYAINKNGDVLSLKRWRKPHPSILSKWINKRGYICYTLIDKNNKQRSIPAHRLVAKTFLTGWDKSKCVNHIDGNKQNNHCSNLEMVTNQQNTDHAVKIGLINNKGEKAEGAKLKNSDVINIRKIYSEGKLSQHKIAEIYEVDQTTIWAIVNNKTFLDVGV